MVSLLVIIKYIVILQLIIIAFFIFLSYLSKYYFRYQYEHQEIAIEKISQLLTQHLQEQQLMTLEEQKYLRKKVDLLIPLLRSYGKMDKKPKFYNQLEKHLAETILRPAGQKLSYSRFWLQRYYAADCFLFHYEEEDEPYLFHLINDDSLLVSLLAALIAIKNCSVVLINEMISTYAQGRHLQQSFLSQVAIIENIDIYPIVAERLFNEEEPYTKVFCYRLLARLPKRELLSCVNTDLLLDLLDLKISIVDYLANSYGVDREELLYREALSPAWELRAAVAKALATVHSKKSLEILAILITDLEWWVRINSANSLYKLGKEGIAILNAQSPEKDKFAYETAQKVLLTGRIHA